MYPVSNAFLQKIRENTREYYWTGTIITTHGTRYTFQNADILKGSVYINHKSCSADEMEIGCWSQARLAIFRPVELTNFRTYKNSQCTFSFRFTYYLMVIIHQLLLLQFHICFHDSCFL